MPASVHFNGFATNAFAEEDGGSNGSKGTGGHKGQGGESDKGKGGSGKGKGGKDAVYKGDSENHQKGKSDTSGNKGKPVWAQEGIPEGEYGRLNVARAPQHTRDQAKAEALSSTSDWYLYHLTTVDAIKAAILAGTRDSGIADNPDTPTIDESKIAIVRVDSPTQSLALYQAVLKGESIAPLSGGSAYLQAVTFLASASDKTKPITADTVKAMNIILGVSNPAGVTNEQLAADADAVRLAILAAHGE
ncbi:MAG: hypothetical protein PHQ90_12700 [Sulfuricurvum sp.]|uniref:hypothetical protein n=1 Tax=Sulfuricurvum sp. TaxID=2025608 RepID=UPI002616F299|nr:hypothetical protein [Sulfuricurvum sp.]MDD2370154.1 hypothetical protein [Sulfuricurvum sp.]MDD2949703.1 hypothetical protein [Sulfuricurvum sp.]MDD5118918.1 hypothetical protein [Sulfuricurvum sp.]